MPSRRSSSPSVSSDDPSLRSTLAIEHLGRSRRITAAALFRGEILTPPRVWGVGSGVALTAGGRSWRWWVRRLEQVDSVSGRRQRQGGDPLESLWHPGLAKNPSLFPVHAVRPEDALRPSVRRVDDAVAVGV